MIVVLKNLKENEVELAINSIYKISSTVPLYLDMNKYINKYVISSETLKNKSESKKDNPFELETIFSSLMSGEHLTQISNKFLVSTKKQKCIGDNIVKFREVSKSASEKIKEAKSLFNNDILYQLLKYRPSFMAKININDGFIIIDAGDGSVDRLIENLTEEYGQKIFTVSNSSKDLNCINISNLTTEESFISAFESKIIDEYSKNCIDIKSMDLNYSFMKNIDLIELMCEENSAKPKEKEEKDKEQTVSEKESEGSNYCESLDGDDYETENYGHGIETAMADA